MMVITRVRAVSSREYSFPYLYKSTKYQYCLVLGIKRERIQSAKRPYNIDRHSYEKFRSNKKCKPSTTW